MEPPHRGGFLASVEDMFASQILLDLENAVYTFGWDVPLIRLVVQEWRVLSIVDDDVDLVAALASRVDHKRPVSLITPWQMIVEDANPVLFRCLATGAGVCHGRPIAAQATFQPRLQAVQDVSQSVGHRVRHLMMSFQYGWRAECAARLAIRSFSVFVSSSDRTLLVFAGSITRVEARDDEMILNA